MQALHHLHEHSLPVPFALDPARRVSGATTLRPDVRVEQQTESWSGDGSPWPANADGLRLVLADAPASRTEEEAWADRSRAVQAEARAALQTPFHRPPTWQVL